MKLSIKIKISEGHPKSETKLILDEIKNSIGDKVLDLTKPELKILRDSKQEPVGYLEIY